MSNGSGLSMYRSFRRDRHSKDECKGAGSQARIGKRGTQLVGGQDVMVVSVYFAAPDHRREHGPCPVRRPVTGQGTRSHGSNGAAKYTLTTDYVLPSHNWVPVYNPCLTTGSFGTRLYYAGRGGTIYYIDNPIPLLMAHRSTRCFTHSGQLPGQRCRYNSTIFINTPMTADSNGNVFFGFPGLGTAPAPLSTTQSGFARIDSNGNGTYVLAGDSGQRCHDQSDSHNSAPALITMRPRFTWWRRTTPRDTDISSP